MYRIINFIKGIFIGIAVVIPGLSGSIFAVAVGLYDKILNSINTFRKNIKTNILFMIPIVLGCAAGILLSTKLVLWLCGTFTFQAYFVFTGLVLGSFPLIYTKIRKIQFKPVYLILTVISFILISGTSFIIESNTSGSSYISMYYISNIKDAFIIFLSGLISCSLMAVPGVSGSVMLMVMKQYGTVYNAVSNVTDSIKSIFTEGTIPNESVQGLFIILFFILGALTGFILIAKLLGYLLRKFEPQVYYAVAGLITGAVFTLVKDGIYPNLAKINENLLFNIAISAVCVGAGIFCTIFLDDSKKAE